jgi:hypothetical protein
MASGLSSKLYKFSIILLPTAMKTIPKIRKIRPKITMITEYYIQDLFKVELTYKANTASLAALSMAASCNYSQ